MTRLVCHHTDEPRGRAVFQRSEEDPGRLHVLVAAPLAEVYGFTDIGGRQPPPLTLDEA